MYRVITGSFSVRRVALVLVEHALIVLAVVVAAIVRLGFPEVYSDWVLRSVVVAAVLQVCLHYSDLYDLRTLSDRRDLLIGLLQSLGAASVILAVFYYWFPISARPRRVRARHAAHHRARRRVAHRLRVALAARHSERLLIVGTGVAAVSLARELFERRSELGVELVGFVDSDPAKVGTPLINPGVIGTVNDIPSIVRGRDVDRVVVSLADARGKLNMDELLDMKMNDGVRFDHLASVYEQYTGKIAVENLRPSWMIFSDGFSKSDTPRGHRSACRRRVRLGGPVLASPLMLGVWLALRLRSPGPAIYSQVRVGKDGVPLHHPQVPLDAGRCRSRHRRRVGEAERPARDAGSADSCAAPASTSCRSCGTCCAAT